MSARLPTEERQAEIVSAALRLAREISPPLITTAEIAAAIGVSQGAVFKHFASKEAIWLAAMTWVRQALMTELEAAAAAAASPVDALRAVFKSHVGFVLAHPGVPRFIFHELQLPADSPVKQEVRALLQAYRKLLLQLLSAGVRSRDFASAIDAEAAATLFVGVVQGLVMQSMASGKTAPSKAQADSVFGIYLRGIAR
jgi:AcrR family transcriptional regulator